MVGDEGIDALSRHEMKTLSKSNPDIGLRLQQFEVFV
jgi:hypothetical protein